MADKNLLLPMAGPRVAALVALTPPCALAAEIGADHGIISAHLLRGGRCARMIVADVSAASLAKARRLFAAHGLEERAEFRVADGLDAVDEPVDAILIAGMGAGTMTGILRRGVERIGGAALILQANQDVPAVRAWLAGNGFAIEAESIAREGRRFYVVMRARRGEAAHSARALYLGPCLLRERPDAFAPYLRWRRDCLLRVRRADVRQEIEWIEEALGTCETR